jgi:hypothetical protein
MKMFFSASTPPIQGASKWRSFDCGAGASHHSLYQRGDEVVRGDRISLIQFGSRVTFTCYLARIQVKLGDKLVGGESVLACSNEINSSRLRSTMPSSETENGPVSEPKLKIYFLPNLLTAGNLFCGFVALTKIVEGCPERNFYHEITIALSYILLACIFDLFDGRVARMGGVESPFGREFDSLADMISSGPPVPRSPGGSERRLRRCRMNGVGS